MVEIGQIFTIQRNKKAIKNCLRCSDRDKNKAG